MKITEVKKEYSNHEVSMVQPKIEYVKEFIATMSDEEKESKTYFDWENKRIFELIQANQKEIESCFLTKEDFLYKGMVFVAHLFTKMKISSIDLVDIDFNSTKENVKKESLDLNVRIDLLENFKESKFSPSKSETIKTEDGEQIIYNKFESILNDSDNIVIFAKKLFEKTKEFDLTGKKTIEIIAILTSFVEYMSLVNAQFAEFELSSLTNENDSEEEQEFLKNKKFKIEFNLKKIKFENILKGNKLVH